MRLLIVDDSALMRRVLTECFDGMPDIEVAVARDGEDALEVALDFRPDVITLDINMPKMDGLTCLAHLTERWPCPVIMVSSLTEKGALTTFEALELGAMDFVAKPGGTVSLNLDTIFDELRHKVRAAARARRQSARPHAEPPAIQPKPTGSEPRAVSRPAFRGTDLVMFGCSTGGPRTIGPILEALPRDFGAPILIAQHMPDRFTGVLANRLADICAIQVQELRSATPLEPGSAYVATGGKDVEVAIQYGRLIARPVPAKPEFTWHPSVSRMVASALDCLPPERSVGVMLTGMGDDGAVEMADLKARGGRTIAEAESTAAIFGMPQRLIARDGATDVLPAHQIAMHLKGWVGTKTRERAAACR